MILSVQQQGRIDALFADIPARRAPGCVIGLLREGEPVQIQSYGLASIEHDVAIAADTRFRIASVSKQFTVAALLMLAAEGRLKLDDEARAYLPELPELEHPVRLEHLMRNTSGLPDFLELLRLGGVEMVQRMDRAAMFEAICRSRHLNFAPGSRFLYSNSNFLLLGLIVEKLSGQTLGAFLRERIFTPLGMADTELLAGKDEVAERLAAPYLPDEAASGEYRRALHGFEHGGEGGLVSTAGDLLRWAAEMLAPGPELAPVITALQEATALSGGQPSPYARGLERGQWLGRTCLGHGGLWPGYRTEFVLMPEAGLAAVVISNDASRNPYKLARELLRIALNEAPASVASPPAPDLLGEWFDAGSGELLALSVGTDGLLMARQWGTAFELRAEGDGSWLAQRGAYEFRLGALAEDGTLALDIGAGRRLRLQRLAQREALPADLHGSFRCAPIASTWRIEPGTGLLHVQGPLMKSHQPWRLAGLGRDWVELQSEGCWIRPSQLLRIERDAEGRIAALCMEGARVKGLRLLPVER